MLSSDPFSSRFAGVWRSAAFVLFVALYTPLFLLTKPFTRRNPYLFAHVLYWGVASIVGIRLRTFGEPCLEPSTLFMSNHTSYLDVPALGRVVPAFFVAKSDVAHWPIFGKLTKIYNTVYVERKAARAAAQRDGLRPLLEEGRSLVIFPEGTSTDGREVLPFKSSLFSLAEGALPSGGYVHVQPISIVCVGNRGSAKARAIQPFYAWYGDQDFLPHLWEAFQRGGFEVDVIFHKPQTVVEAGGNRKTLAAWCYEQVKSGVDAAHNGSLLPKVPETN